MKRILSALALVLTVAMMMTLFAACGPQTPAGDQVTVTWYQGSTVLKTEKVAKGSTLTTWTPTVEGKTFMGWFSEASCTQAFDFATVINEDTDIFAAFMSSSYTEDTNAYYLVGTGSGDMKVSGWDAANADNKLMMTKDTSITDKNVYTIEITMYAGDRFQICYGGGWDGQQGIGHIPGAAYADGVNPNNNASATAADKEYAEVKNADGEVVFIGGDEYDKEFYVWNIILNEGHDGKYKFTLTTYPGNTAYNTIEWELVEKVQPLTQTHDMHIIGSFNEWNATSTDYPMTKSEDGTHWIGYLTITADQYVDYGQATQGAALKVINHVDGVYYGDAAGENIFLPEGTYCIKYTVEGNVVEIQKLGYYIVGTLLDAEGNSVNFAVKEGVSPALTVANGIASCTLNAYDATKGAGYDWMTAQGKPGVMAIKVVYGCEFGIQTWYSDDANGGDNWYLPLGTYNVSLNIETGAVTVTAG